MAAEDPQSDVVYGCGINGEVNPAARHTFRLQTDYGWLTRRRLRVRQLTVARVADDSLTLLNNTVAPSLLQSRAMLWYNRQLVVSNRDFLFYDVDSRGGLKLARNISIDAPAFWGDQKQGTNGMMVATDGQDTTLLVGAAMPGLLVAVSLQLHGSGHPEAFGYRNASDFRMGGVYDIDAYDLSAHAPHLVQGPPPLAVAVSPGESQTTLGIIRMHDPTTNAFLPVGEWKQLGSISVDEVVRSSEELFLLAQKLAQKLGQLLPCIAVFPQECMGQLAYFGPT